MRKLIHIVNAELDNLVLRCLVGARLLSECSLQLIRADKLRWTNRFLHLLMLRIILLIFFNGFFIWIKILICLLVVFALLLIIDLLLFFFFNHFHFLLLNLFLFLIYFTLYCVLYNL